MRRNPYYSGPVSDHFDGQRFFAPGGHKPAKIADVLRWCFEKDDRAAWPRAVANPRVDHPPQQVDGPSLRVSVIGHASLLVQTAGLNILIDPVWSERVSPFTFVGPRRIRPPGMPVENLPDRLDAILITHNHYDHMDLETLRRLAHLRPARIIAPLGNDVIINRALRGSAIIAESYDWGDRVRLSQETEVILEPSLHWSSRYGLDSRMALWGSYVLRTPFGSLYLMGDSGFGDGSLFEQAREKYPNICFASIPIGAYAPRWFMRRHHMGPEEAAHVFSLLGAKNAVAFHWGVFRLSDEPLGEPPERLMKALLGQGIAPGRFFCGEPGSFLFLDDMRQSVGGL